MITSTISFRVAPGKNHEAAEYFQTVVRQVKKITGTELRVLTQLGGPMGHFILSSTYPTLNDWNEGRQKLQADQQFQKLVTQAGQDGLFIAGTVESALWQQV